MIFVLLITLPIYILQSNISKRAFFSNTIRDRISNSTQQKYVSITK